MQRWGIIGLGKIASKFAQDLALVNNAELKAVASRDILKAEKFKSTHQFELAFGSYAELLDCSEVDIIYIATPHNSHFEWSLAAMKKGKHVLCEKPLAVQGQEVKTLIETSKQQKVFLMEGLWSRFNPCIQSVLERIKNQAIGKVNYINADFCFAAALDKNSRLTDPNRAGGALLDIGIYPVFLAYIIFGMPKEIKATSRMTEAGVDMQTAMLFSYENGIANLMCSLMSKSEMKARIYGAEGSITINDRWHEANSFIVNKEGVEEVCEYELKGNGFVPEIEATHVAISNSDIESKLWSHQNSLDLISLLDKVRDQVGLRYPFEN